MRRLKTQIIGRIPNHYGRRLLPDGRFNIHPFCLEMEIKIMYTYNGF